MAAMQPHHCFVVARGDALPRRVHPPQSDFYYCGPSEEEQAQAQREAQAVADAKAGETPGATFLVQNLDDFISDYGDEMRQAGMDSN